MAQQILEKLFDSPAKLRLLKLFLRNANQAFTAGEIRKKTLLPSGAVRRELDQLTGIQFITNTKKRNSKDRVYTLNNKFVFLQELQNLILKSSPTDQQKMTEKFKGLGRVKLAVLSGIFLKPEREGSRTDILLVCDGANETRLSKLIKNLEAEAGAELNYAVLTSEEFSYRRKMFDRFVLDILEKPHKKLINKIFRV